MKIKAFSKLNLTLDICGKREDGYHILDSIMQSVEPFDIVTIEKGQGITVACSDNSLCGESNIAHKAAEAFFNATQINGGAEIYIEKHIPQTAGLGGGSADAAAVISGLNRLYETGLSNDKLCEIALTVGADVPFCIAGGTARMGGIGEVITPIQSPQGLYFVIAKNGVKGSTKEMYAAVDTAEKPHEPQTEAAVCALQSGDNTALIKNIGNAFAAITGLYGIDTLLADTNPLAVSLSGSGPTVFAVYDNLTSAYGAYTKLCGQGIACFVSRAQQNGIVFE